MKATKSEPGLNLADPNKTDVEHYEFEPIKGYPMLRWRGKRPFTSTQYYPAQLKEIHGPEVDGWRNKIYWGDNLQVMSHLLKDFRGKIDLIYIDPPFDSKADYKKKISIKGTSTSNNQNAFEEKQYTDIWSNDEYLQFMYERLTICSELLSRNGSIYVHCDYRKSSYLRLILDEIFGAQNFINEIIWVRTSSHNMKSKGFVRSNDHLLLYSKGSEFIFNEQYTEYGEAQMSRYRPDENGKLYKAENLTFSSTNPDRQFEWRGTTPPSNRSWGMNKDDLEALWATGRILTKRDGTPRLDGWKIYLDDTKGSPLTCNWADISRVGNTSSERTEYPTQKPEGLLERIINTSSNKGCLVFDCFMGSGTTQAVATKLNRKFIGADINLGAIQTTTKRLLGIVNEKDANLLDPENQQKNGFEVYNVNHYDIFRNPVEARDLLIQALEINKMDSGTVWDGEKDGWMIKLMPVNRIATKADLNEIITGVDWKAYEKRSQENSNRPVERIRLVCMGHEPDLAAELELQLKPNRVEVEVLDILRDKSNLQFKRDSQARIVTKGKKLIIERFYPMNLLQKLSLQKEEVSDWREMTESVMIDWNYDGVIFNPTTTDIPEKNELVSGEYEIPADAGTIHLKITDLLSESWEGNIHDEG